MTRVLTFALLLVAIASMGFGLYILLHVGEAAPSTNPVISAVDDTCDRIEQHLVNCVRRMMTQCQTHGREASQHDDAPPARDAE